MVPVTIGPELVAQLTSNGGKVPLSDQSGNPVGYFLSPEQYESMRRAVMEKLTREPTLEEFRAAIANSRRWYTTEEVLKLLEE